MVKVFGDREDGSIGPQGPGLLVVLDLQDHQALPDSEALKEVKGILERMVLKKYIDGFQTW